MPTRRTSQAEEPATPAPEVDTGLTLAQRINKAREIIGGTVEKRGRNSEQKYDFVAAADVARAVGDALNQVGVTQIVSHDFVEPKVIEYASRSGTKMFLSVVKTTLTLVKAEDKVIGASLQGVPNAPERVIVTAVAFGADTGDKGPFKAMTGGLKYAQLGALGLATGDDPENSSEPAVAVTPDAVAAPQPKVAQRRKTTEAPAEEAAPVNAAEAATEVGSDPKAPITTAQTRLLFGTATKKGLGPEEFRSLMFITTGKRNSKQLNNQDVSDILESMEDEAIIARAKSPTDEDQLHLAAAEAAGEGSTAHPAVGPAAERDPFD